MSRAHGCVRTNPYRGETPIFIMARELTCVVFAIFAVLISCWSRSRLQ